MVKPATAKPPPPAKTPAQVREEFLSRGQIVCGVKLEPFSLATFWLLEEINHPLFRGGSDTIELKEIAQAIFVFSDSATAFAALTQGRPVFDREVRRVAKSIPVGDIQTIMGAIVAEFVGNLPTANA
jgi:hypothetical protein